MEKYLGFHNSHGLLRQSSKIHFFNVNDSIANGLCGRNFTDLKWMECWGNEEFTKEQLLSKPQQHLCSQCVKKLV